MQDKNLEEYFYYQTPSFLTKDLYEGNQVKNDRIEKYLNESLIDFRKSNRSKGVPKKENPNKIIDIVETTLNSNKKQKGKDSSYPLLNKCFKDYQ